MGNRRLTLAAPPFILSPMNEASSPRMVQSPVNSGNHRGPTPSSQNRVSNKRFYSSLSNPDRIEPEVLEMELPEFLRGGDPNFGDLF